MKRVAMEEFRKNAQRLLAQCRRMREPIAITRFGEEVARLVPRKRSLRDLLRDWMRSALEIFRRPQKQVRKHAVWGVFLKFR